MASASVTTDSQGRFQAVSPAFLTLTGRPVQELAGVELLDLVHPDRAAVVRRALSQTDTTDELTTTTTMALVFVAGDQWLPMSVTLRGAGNDRIHVALATPVTGNAAHETVLPAETVLPDDTVPERRAAARARAGGATTAMLEIDGEGRTVFVAGPWAALSATGKSGADAFEEVLAQTPHASAVLDAIDSTMAHATSHRFETSVANESLQMQVQPIASPHRAGENHALISVSQAANAADPIDAAPSVEATNVGAQVEAHDAFAEPSRWSTVTKVALGIAVLALVAFAVFRPQSSTDEVVLNQGSLDVEIIATEPQQVDERQVWRSLGIGGFGEAHGIATVGDEVFLAGVDGRVAQLDATGAARSVIGIGSDDATFVSDIVGDPAGSAWVLDAGGGRLYWIDAGRQVQTVSSDARFLKSARGLGVGENNTVWIASTAAAQLTQVAADGSVVAEILTPDRQPSDVVQAPDGTLWMVDSQDLELVQVSVEGRVLSEVGLETFSSLESPHLALADNTLWVTQPDQSAVVAIDLSTGEQVVSLELRRPSGEPIRKAIGITVGPDAQVWISDSVASAVLIVDAQ